MTDQSNIDTQQLLSYADHHFDTFSYLNGNVIAYPHGAFPEMIGMGVKATFEIAPHNDFAWESLDCFIATHQGHYMIGYLNYQLKNKIEHFPLTLNDPLNFALVQLYVPQYLFIKTNNNWKPYDKDSEALLPHILAFKKTTLNEQGEASTAKEHFSHDEYIGIVNRIKQELAQGNIYEINFCNSYTGSYKNLDYVNVYGLLNAISPMPFSALHKHEEHIVISASPERFLQKKGNKITSQPIKGTASRKADPLEDLAQRQALENSLKERTENIMIVDLVRNDLSKLCVGGTVKVEELCKAYTFEKVHQLISTISGDLEQANLSFSEVIKAMFPMGSMTGAPKYKAMQLIDELEQVGRGLFSGTLGYIAPNGDFDFNVIIRSLLLNEKLRIYQYHAGSAITMASDAELEYQECSLKTLPIRMLGISSQGSVVRDQ